jgi:hypothetical protein
MDIHNVLYSFPPHLLHLTISFTFSYFSSPLSPHLLLLLDVAQRNLIVLYDLMTQSRREKRIAGLFAKRSHHRNFSVIFIVQNIFHQDKETTTLV